MARVEIVAVLVDGKFTPSPSREFRGIVPIHVSQALTADNRVLTLEVEVARELARALKGHKSVWVETR
jgi:hypothetical protein